MASVLQIVDFPFVNQDNKDIESLVKLDTMFIPMAGNYFTVTNYGETRSPSSSPPSSPSQNFEVSFGGLPLPVGMSNQNTLVKKVSNLLRTGISMLVSDDY
jgi:hypothetical protein